MDESNTHYFSELKHYYSLTFDLYADAVNKRLLRAHCDDLL